LSVDAWQERNRKDASIFNFSARCVWGEQIDPGRFEELAYALLQEEPGVEWLRATGTVRDRDQGRDLIARWILPRDRQRLNEKEAEAPFAPRDVIVQVKTRQRTVGKADVRDVRDTLERHGVSGFFLIAFPNISNDLLNYLGTLRSQGYWTDWWTRQQLEDRLRRNPHIAQLFSDLVDLVTD